LALQSYRCAAQDAEAERVEKKSRFIARVCPVHSQEAAEAFVAQVREKHSTASHNVPVYIVGLQAEIQKASDDGEPSGTAGAPVLEVLKKHGLVNTAVVVTRYFGGTLLGRGGLIRAYTKTAQDALEKSGIALYIPQQEAAVTVDYSASGRVANFLETAGHRPVDTEYGSDVTFHLRLLPEELDQVYRHIQELTADAFLWQAGREVYGRRRLSFGK